MRASLVLFLVSFALGCGSSADDLALCARLSACATGTAGSIGFTCGLLQQFDQIAQDSDGSSEKQVRASFRCLRDAKTCAETTACTAATPAQVSACGPMTASRCDGNVLVRCNETPPTALDCGEAGLICGAYGDGAGCGVATCDPATMPKACDGSLIATCDQSSHVLRTNDCRVQTRTSCSSAGGPGQTCQTRVGDTCTVFEGEPRCTGDGADCDEDTYQNSCDGTVMVTCAAGKIGRRDCASYGLGLVCGVGTYGQVECTGKSKACTDDTPEACDGTTITMCVFGDVVKLDCKAYGWSGCSTSVDEGKTVARCLP